jgi:hypothetical protein
VRRSEPGRPATRRITGTAAQGLASDLVLEIEMVAATLSPYQTTFSKCQRPFSYRAWTTP